jgi:hypothetical protein
VRREHGDDVAGSLVVFAVHRVPLTEQGKPDRAALHRLAERADTVTRS